MKKKVWVVKDKGGDKKKNPQRGKGNRNRQTHAQTHSYIAEARN